jgi:hypothetical protein
MRDEEKSSKPREMVHAAQAEAINWTHQYRRAHQGATDADELERIRAELHAAVMLYWEQLSRFAGRKQIETAWADETVFGDVTLEDLRKYRFAASKNRESQYDPDSGSAEPTVVEEPWRLEPRQALAVLDQLNKCAHLLGFDASPKDTRDRFTIAREDGETPEPHNDHVKQPN